jgi:hypothetical protein
MYMLKSPYWAVSERENVLPSHLGLQTGYYSCSGTLGIPIVGNPAAGNAHPIPQIMGFRILTALLLLPLSAFAQSAPTDPLALPTRDAHQNLLIVADPYVSAGRYKGMFGKKSPYEAGIVAIDVFFRNDNDSPIRLNPDTIELVVSSPGEDRQRLTPLSPEDVADRTVLKTPSNPTVRRRLPFPIGGSNSSKGKEWNEMVSMLRSVALGTAILPPHATVHGFLFFDLNHEFDAIRHSHVFIPDLAFMGSNKALFFFEIDLGLAPTK